MIKCSDDRKSKENKFKGQKGDWRRIVKFTFESNVRKSKEHNSKERTAYLNKEEVKTKSNIKNQVQKTLLNFDFQLLN